MKSHNQMIVETLLNNWTCYGKLMAKNDYASSLPRSLCKLREKVESVWQGSEIDLIGILSYEGKKYKWFERMDGKVKYFYLEEQPIMNVVGQTQLFDRRSMEKVS